MPRSQRSRVLRRLGVLAGAAALISLGSAASAETFHLEEASLADVSQALDSGVVSSVELTVLYLNRIAAYDRHGPVLNAIPILNPQVLVEAATADAARRAGIKAPLLGVPFTVKDSYKVRGLTVAAGSPAFASMIANEDAFTIGRIRSAGGVLIGKTNMPPLAAGGMQKGVYGRAESPYNGEYLTAAWNSGSSNGSATSTTANFAMFGMGEETVSSGRSPASNNALIAYTPSRGLLSIRGNWPLFPFRDVVVPHTRSVRDLLALLNVIQVSDPITTGDFWRDQKVVKLPSVESVRPRDFLTLARTGALRGKRIGVPTMYIGKDSAEKRPITVRPSIIALWQKAADDLRKLGAQVVEVDFDLMHDMEMDRPQDLGPVKRGLIPENWFFGAWSPPGAPNNERSEVIPFFAEQFVRLNGDPKVPSWITINPDLVFPTEPHGMEAATRGPTRDYRTSQKLIAQGLPDPATLPGYGQALEGIERTRKVELEDWMRKERLDLVVFPSAADLGKADANMVKADYEAANLNGVYFSNMNQVLRLLGIPSVSVPMGIISDIGMPVNLTFIGPAYSDPQLLSYAYDYEQGSHNRRPPPRTPALPGEVITYSASRLQPPASRADKTPPAITFSATAPRVTVSDRTATATLQISGTAFDDHGLSEVRLYVNGERVPVTLAPLDVDGVAVPSTLGGRWIGNYALPRTGYADRDLMVIALAKDTADNASASLSHFSIAADGTVTPLPKAPLPPCDICVVPYGR